MGVVKNITPYGVFVELTTGIGGMIHISDLSWLKRFNNPNEYTKVGNEIEVIIMNIDKEGRKLQLGHKQIEEDPWNSLESTFPVGSEHEGTVVKKDDKGAIVQLPYGLEGFAPARHLAKEDGKSVGIDEIAKFMVIEFDRNDKRIVLSHARLWEQVIEEEKQLFQTASITATGWSLCAEWRQSASFSSSTPVELRAPDAIASTCAMVPYSSSSP